MLVTKRATSGGHQPSLRNPKQSNQPSQMYKTHKKIETGLNQRTDSIIMKLETNASHHKDLPTVLKEIFAKTMSRGDLLVILTENNLTLGLTAI
jgi:hypothetical protein